MVNLTSDDGDVKRRIAYLQRSQQSLPHVLCDGAEKLNRYPLKRVIRVYISLCFCVGINYIVSCVVDKASMYIYINPFHRYPCKKNTRAIKINLK